VSKDLSSTSWWKSFTIPQTRYLVHTEEQVCKLENAYLRSMHSNFRTRTLTYLKFVNVLRTYTYT